MLLPTSDFAQPSSVGNIPAFYYRNAIPRMSHGLTGHKKYGSSFLRFEFLAACCVVSSRYGKAIRWIQAVIPTAGETLQSTSHNGGESVARNLTKKTRVGLGLKAEHFDSPGF